MSYQIEFTLTGEMPLLMHADNIDGADLLQEWRKDPANKNLSVPGDDRSPPWTWQTYLYHDGEYVTMPAENVMVALRQAGAQVVLKKQKTFKEASQSGMIPQSEHFAFLVDGQPLEVDRLLAIRDEPYKTQADAVKKMGFQLFAKRAKVGQSKHVRVRPRFDRWSVRGSLLVVKPEITWEIAQTLFALAGQVGLSDWRPGCRTPGPYGMFTSELKQVK